MKIATGRLALVCLALGTPLAACAGNGDTVGTTSVGSCGAPSGQVALSYPAPGSTGIPDNIQGVVFAASSGLSGTYQALVVPAGSSQGIAFERIAAAPSPIPSPNATPIANAIYQESASGGVILPAATTVAVYLNDSASTCTPSLQGSFTTQ